MANPPAFPAQYTDLITPEHEYSPKFVQTVEIGIKPLCDIQNVLYSMLDKYDLDLAVGVQLDAVGLWVGRSRQVTVPISGVYFSFDTSSIGFDEGVWKRSFDPTEGLTYLDDATYKLLLKAVIASNNWDGTITGAAAALATLFNDSLTPGTKLWIQDNLDMSMAFILSGQIPSPVFQGILAEGLVPLRPVGVNASYLITSINGSSVFAFDMNNEFGAGFDTGAWAIPITV